MNIHRCVCTHTRISLWGGQYAAVRSNGTSIGVLSSSRNVQRRVSVRPERVARNEQRRAVVKAAALAGVSGDAVFEEMVAQALDEAISHAHAMAAEATREASTPTAAKALAQSRELPLLPPPPTRRSEAPDDQDGDGGARYSGYFDALIRRTLRHTLQLLPLDRLSFALVVGRWVVREGNHWRGATLSQLTALP